MENTSAFVNGDGTLNYEGAYQNLSGIPTEFAVRPAFWMKVATGFTVKYLGNNCLSVVPTDNNIYQPGDKVTVLFDPVAYIPGLIFNGWDMDGDGVANFGYYYYTFTMPNRNVELKAICYMPYIPDTPVDTPNTQRPNNPPDNQRPNNPWPNQWPDITYDQPNIYPDQSGYIPDPGYNSYWDNWGIPPFSDMD